MGAAGSVEDASKAVENGTGGMGSKGAHYSGTEAKKTKKLRLLSYLLRSLHPFFSPPLPSFLLSRAPSEISLRSPGVVEETAQNVVAAVENVKRSPEEAQEQLTNLINSLPGEAKESVEKMYVGPICMLLLLPMKKGGNTCLPFSPVRGGEDILRLC